MNTRPRSGWSTWLFSLTLLAALILGPLATPDALAASPRTSDDGRFTEPPAALSSTDWIFQGPAPQVNAQQDLANITASDEPVSGAVSAIAASPTNPDLVYLGAANGGVWKTTNATAASPTWTPLTDHLQSLSIGIGALALDPLDATGQTVIAGTGRFSGYANRGDDLVGLYYTANGGASWTVTISPLLSAARITGVAARGNTLLAASENGLFRSTTGPLGSWTQISGTGGLPTARASSIVADPANTNRLYVTFTGASGGLFRSDDTGATWSNITGAINVISSDTTAFDVAVYNDGATSVVTALLNGTVSGAPGNAIFRSVNGAAFTALDVPFVFDNAYGKFGLTADRTDPDLVYVSGGYVLPGTGPFLASTTRVDASQPSNAQLTLLYSGVSTKILTDINASQTFMYVDSTASFLTPPPFDVTVDGEQMTVTAITKPSWYYRLALVRGANATTAAAHTKYALVFSSAAYGAPHVDINNLATDANGSLLMGSHGGIFHLPDPAGQPSSVNTWLSKNGNLGVSEMHDIAYDHVSGTLIGSNQDNCVVFQSAPGNQIWPVGPDFSGDGGDVAVADIGGGQSARYAANQNIGGFQRLIYNAANTLVSATTLSTAVITDKQFTTPIAVNAVDPNRLLIGGSANLYESLNMGDTINKIATVGVNTIYGRPMAYGGRRNGIDNPDVLYVSSGTDTFYARTTAGGAVAATGPLPAGAWYLSDLVMNPEDWWNVFAVDSDQVFASSDGGATWSDITGNLLSVSSSQITTIEFVEAPSPYVVVGTRSGVFASNLGSLGSWFKLGTALPDVLVFELDYDAVDDVLAGGTLGRGAWLLSDASTALTPAGVPPVVVLSGPTTANEGSTNYSYSFTVTDPGDSFTIQDLTIGAGGNLVSGSLVTAGNGGSFQVNFPDGPASVSIDLQVLDSTGLLSNAAATTVTVSNVKPTPAILGLPTSGSPGTPINVTASATDPSTVDTSAGFTYAWQVDKLVGATWYFFSNGAGPTFSFTPDAPTTYKVWLKATDKDNGYTWTSKTMTAASPDLTIANVSITVPEGQAAANSGTYAHQGPAPLTISASVGTVQQTQTSTTALNVLGYWQLGEDDPGATGGGAGNNPTVGRDASGLNPALNLTRSGGPTYVAVDGSNGSVLAMSLNGSSDSYDRATPVTTVTSNFGIEARVRPTTASGTQVIAYNGHTGFNGFGLVITGGTYQGLYGSITFMNTGVAATAGVWHDVALVNDNGVTKMYVDGTPLYNSNVGAPNPAGTGFAIAKSPGTSLNYFGGSVDDVRIFTFSPGTFNPQDLGVNTSVAGTWSWSYTPDDGPAGSQNVTITASTGVPGDTTSLPFPLTVDNIAPAAAFAPNIPTIGEGGSRNVSFSNQFDPSTADTTALFRYAYDFDNDGIFEIGDGAYAGSSISAGASVPASFLAEGPGTRTIRGRILDKDGGYSDYTTTITINNRPPTASVSGPSTALAGQLATFVLGATDFSAIDQAAGFTYSINWGDGSPLQTINPVEGTGGATARHAYATPNSYTIQVTATDKDGAVSLTPASKAITVNPLDASSLQALIATAPFVDLMPADNTAFQNEVAAINGLTDPGTPVAITIVLGAGSYSGVTASPPNNIILDFAGTDTRNIVGTTIVGASPALTVAAGEVFAQGLNLTTATDSPTVLVTGGHLTLDQVEIQESSGFNNVAVNVAGGSANLGFDVIMNVNGDGGFVNSYVRTALVPHPEGIDAELTPNTYQVDGETIHAVSLSSTSLTSSAATTTSGQNVTFTAVIDVKAIEHGLATGTVSFYDGAALLGDSAVSYTSGQFVATFTTGALSIGDHTITAVYGGDEAYVASSAALMHDVTPPLAVTLANFTAEPHPGYMQVNWETVSEIDNAGFNLYRTLTPDGELLLLAYLPSPAPGSAQGATYSYQDSDVVTGQTYWYWLEFVALSGGTTLYEPVSAVYQTPTAVAASSLTANSALTVSAGWLAAALLMAALAAGFTWRRRSIR